MVTMKEHKGRYIGLMCSLLFCLPAAMPAQQPKMSESQREVKQQIRQDKAMKDAKEEIRSVGYKPSVRKRMELGKAAYDQEQYAIAFDRYLRAYEKEKDSARRVLIEYALGQCQQRLNHPKAAAMYYSRIWRYGLRDADFLQSYTDVLFSLGEYKQAEQVLEQIKKSGRRNPVVDTREESLSNYYMQAAEMQEAFGLLPKDLHYDSAINTAFSEYAPSLVGQHMIFSSSRPQDGQTVSDPRTAQGYSRLYWADFDPVRNTWGNPRPLTGEIADLEGNVGIFSYDSVRNIGYFTWNQTNSSGIYTVQQLADGSWGGLTQFKFNYKEGEGDFLGEVAHPSISRDGNRLLFIYRDEVHKSGTDIWYVERAAPEAAPSTGRKKRVTPPSAQKNQSSSRRKQPQSTVGQPVIVNSEWGVPVRYGESVNTSGREAFPQWVNDSMFVFASDGHAGLGGTDLYLAVLDSLDKSQVKRVHTFPMPINSSYDDNTLLPDRKHNNLILSSNRHVGWGRTDNIFLLRKWGVKYKVEGRVGWYKPRIDSAALTSAPIPAFLPSDTLAALTDTLPVVDSLTAAAPDSLAAVPASHALPEPVYDFLPVKNYYLMVKNKETGFYKSVLPDSTGKYSVPYLEPGTYDFALYAEGFADTVQRIVLEKDGQVLPVLVTRELDFIVRSKIAPKKPTPKPQPVPKKKDTIKKPPVRKPVVKKDSVPSTPKALISNIDKKRKDMKLGPDKRTVDDYQRRVNDPLRRAKLTVLPPDAHCEVCGKEPQWRRNVGEDFYVKAGDDKALITLTDQQGHVSYVDLAPNTAYGIQIQVTSNNNLPSLPNGITENDIRKKVVTRDYVLFECVPKLSELNDEAYINNLYFDFDKEDLIKDGSRELDRMIIIALKNPQMYFQIEANADERGTDEYNKKLTDRRLNTITSYVEKKGMDMRRVKGISYGESNPLIRHANTEEEHRLNRRTTFRLLNPKAVNVKKGDATYPVAELAAPVSEKPVYMVQVGAFRTPLDNPLDYYQDIVRNNPDLKITYYMDADGLYKYNVGGHFKTVEQARAVVKRLLDQNRECYISAFFKGQRITVSEASAILKHGK